MSRITLMRSTIERVVTAISAVSARSSLKPLTNHAGAVSTKSWELHETMTVAGQPTITYGYDEANRLSSVTQGTSVVAIAYDDANRRSTLTLPNGIDVAYGYDDASQLTSLTYTR